MIPARSEEKKKQKKNIMSQNAGRHCHVPMWLQTFFERNIGHVMGWGNYYSKKNITHVKYIGCCQDVIAVFLRFFPAKLLEVMDCT